MTAKQVLNKILTLLSKDEVNLTYAKLKDGTIVESPTFDVGEDLFVISEDGTKSPAPDGEHELALKDTEGNETLLKVITKDGVIVERENVELEDVEVKDLPQSNINDEANVIKDVETPANNSKGTTPSTLMAEETEEVEGLPEDTDKGETPSIEIELKDIVEKLAYRIEEMEKKILEMEKVKEEVVDKEADEEVMMEEEELPKLDGAPVETKMSAVKAEVKFGKKVGNTQDRFLSKLYK